MPYLPPALIDDQPFPQAWGRDFFLQVRMVNSQYRRHYSWADYYQLKIAPTAADSSFDPIGDAGTTKFDPLYGESVDSTLTAWKQPHGTNGAVKAAGVDLFYDPIRIPRKFRKDTRDEELHKYGFDLTRKATVTIPAALLDEVGITVHAGDKLRWNNEEFNVLQTAPAGWWPGSSNLFLFMVLSVEHRRRGS
jgi:hypothetical protein